MNFLSHSIPYFDQPLLAISTGIPDWMSVVDRKIRVRSKMAAEHVGSSDPSLAQVAAGVVRHVEDDRWFHGTRAFVETNMQLAVEMRDRLPGDAGFRPTFIGHILIEMMLDSFFLRDQPELGERYYGSFRDGVAEEIERCVNQITGKPTDKLAEVIHRYVEHKFLYDYADFDRLHWRLNRICVRVKLPELPEEIRGWLPQAANLVESRRVELMTPPDPSFPHAKLLPPENEFPDAKQPSN